MVLELWGRGGVSKGSALYPNPQPLSSAFQACPQGALMGPLLEATTNGQYRNHAEITFLLSHTCLSLLRPQQSEVRL